MTRIDLITGMLGSGKTTFLRLYAKHFIERGEKIAILENDFGAVNIDMAMLRDLKCENCQLEMISGGGDPDCHKRRFKTQLISLGMQRLDRVILEPSGIFDMDEFFDTLHESPLDRWFEVGSVITIIDAETGEKLPEHMEYIFASEAACAGKLVLSKLSSVQNEPRGELSGRILSHLNRSLETIKCDRRFSGNDLFIKEWSDLSADDLDMLSNAGYRGSSYVKLFSPETIRSSVFYFLHAAFPEDEIKPLISSMFTDSACGGIYRIKGTLPGGNGWLRLNATREKVELVPCADGQPVLIVIGDDMDFSAVDGRFRAVNTDPEYTSIAAVKHKHQEN